MFETPVEWSELGISHSVTCRFRQVVDGRKHSIWRHCNSNRYLGHAFSFHVVLMVLTPLNGGYGLYSLVFC